MRKYFFVLQYVGVWVKIGIVDAVSFCCFGGHCWLSIGSMKVSKRVWCSDAKLIHNHQKVICKLIK